MVLRGVKRRVLSPHHNSTTGCFNEGLYDRVRVSAIHFPGSQCALTPDKIVISQFTTPDLEANGNRKNGLKPAENQHAELA